jgi:hypothetical protein
VTEDIQDVEVEIPQYAIEVQESIPGKESTRFLSLVVRTSGSEARYFLCMADNAERTARVISKNISDAGRDARSRPSLITGTAAMGNGLRKEGRRP